MRVSLSYFNLQGQTSAPRKYFSSSCFSSARIPLWTHGFVINPKYLGTLLGSFFFSRSSIQQYHLLTWTIKEIICHLHTCSLHIQEQNLPSRQQWDNTPCNNVSITLNSANIRNILVMLTMSKFPTHCSLHRPQNYHLKDTNKSLAATLHRALIPHVSKMLCADLWWNESQNRHLALAVSIFLHWALE